ncbi:hypothetical protein [Comamonas sp. JC664]|uniref:hypothetical protein n=1 Tax=Comamonas sp. JC664 TaxID=2801917 RepID=UPI00174BCB52|nr:hypothetical protein [Comamonas sp. JC664]MBL0698959.1 hypothetical protein [Comamonas sp. JC664]GHG79780.1 hypothetical protein GCM10012319_31980 [Comamonas sp. KCTC 72670]
MRRDIPPAQTAEQLRAKRVRDDYARARQQASLDLHHRHQVHRGGLGPLSAPDEGGHHPRHR